LIATSGGKFGSLPLSLALFPPKSIRGVGSNFDSPIDIAFNNGVFSIPHHSSPKNSHSLIYLPHAGIKVESRHKLGMVNLAPIKQL
jgi:hypothetical protein